VEFIAESFYAFFSAISSSWHIKITKRKYKSIKTEELEFQVRYIKINGYDTKQRLGALIQEVIGKNIEFEWVKNRITLLKWGELEKINHWTGFDPDKPKNLAKCVTVK